MDVVLYLRYSSDRQNEQSIEGQRRVCEEYCKQNGYTIVGEYADRALSALKDTDKRLQFQQMIRDGDKRLWQGVIVYKLDRFSRNRYDSAIYKTRLKKNGIRVLSATESISDNPEGIILESVLEGMAEFYSKELAQKITRGMYESALKCNSCGGHIPLGYMIQDKKAVINPTTAPLVKEAFEMYADGATVAEICEKFNKAGYRTKKGVPFNKNSFHSMFYNQKYLGVYKFMNVSVDGGMPALIDKETFDKVQARLKRNAQAPARGKAIVDYMLSGKLICGHCGSNMIGTASTSHTGRKYFYYTCGGQRRHNDCIKVPIRKEQLEEAIVRDTIEMLTPEAIEYLADIAISAGKKEIEEHTLLPTLTEEIEEYGKSIDRLLKLVENGAESDSLAKRLNELEVAKRKAERELAKEESSIIALDREQIIYFLTEFTKGDPSDPEFQRRIIDLLVITVVVWNDGDDPKNHKITITYNLTPKKTKTITLKDLAAGCVFEPQQSTITSEYAPYLVRLNVFAITRKHRFE